MTQSFEGSQLEEQIQDYIGRYEIPEYDRDMLEDSPIEEECK